MRGLKIHAYNSAGVDLQIKSDKEVDFFLNFCIIKSVEKVLNALDYADFKNRLHRLCAVGSEKNRFVNLLLWNPEGLHSES